MLEGLTVPELVELRLDLLLMAQQVDSAIVAVLSDKHRQRSSKDYTAEQINGGKKEIEHIELMLRGAVQKIKPTLAAFTQKESVLT